MALLLLLLLAGPIDYDTGDPDDRSTVQVGTVLLLGFGVWIGYRVGYGRGEKDTCKEMTAAQSCDATRRTELQEKRMEALDLGEYERSVLRGE